MDRAVNKKDYRSKGGRRSALLGAIIGDIAGSRFEFCNYKKKYDYHIFSPKCCPTDDTVMSLAIAEALLDSQEELEMLRGQRRCEGEEQRMREAEQILRENAVRSMQRLGRCYPNAGYGGNFYRWIFADQPLPYGSYGNGAAMRISPVGQIARSLEEAGQLSGILTTVSHDHPEAIKGAEAVSAAIVLAYSGKSREEIRAYIERHYYAIDFTLDEIRKKYTFDVSCQGSVPQAMEAFFESEDFEDAIRCAVSIGGDSDTIAAICGSMAAAFYGIPAEMEEDARRFLDEEQLHILDRFEAMTERFGDPDRTMRM